MLEYDDVMNKQRETIYGQRASVLNGESLKDTILKMTESTISDAVDLFLANDENKEDWNLKGLKVHFGGWLCSDEDFVYDGRQLDDVSKADIRDTLISRAKERYGQREAEIGSDLMRELERVVLLRNVDTKWMDHIDAMDELKRGISLQAYAQRDPVVEYRMVGSDMFDEMVQSIKEDTVKMMLTVRVSREAPRREQVAKPMTTSGGSSDGTVKKSRLRSAKGGPQRSLPLRQRQEIQTLLWKINRKKPGLKAFSDFSLFLHQKNKGSILPLLKTVFGGIRLLYHEASK